MEKSAMKKTSLKTNFSQPMSEKKSSKVKWWDANIEDPGFLN